VSSIHQTLQIVIPFRGSLAHLEECVNSTKRNLPPDSKILVFDDRSVFSERPTFLSQDEYFFTGGIGLPQVIEVSKKHITSDFVALMAGDDIPSANRFQLQFGSLATGEFDLCFGLQTKFKYRKFQVPALSGLFLGDEFDISLLLLGPYGADGTIMMTSSFYRDKYILDANDSFSDWALALLHYPESKIAYLNSVLVYYRQHSGQVTRNTRNLWIGSSVQDNWEKLLGKLTDINSVSTGTFNVLAAPWYRSKISNKDIGEAIKVLNEIISKFRQNNLSQRSMYSIEKIIIRRLIFRINETNAWFILAQLRKLNISHVYFKFVLEVILLLKEFVFSIGNAPRLITPPA
jgi:hypothetical protein